MMNKNISHVGYLDGLRGMACLSVVLSHMSIFIVPAFSKDGLFSWDVYKQILLYWVNGDFAVCIFFILSGYVLIMNYMKHPHEQYLAKAAMKRYFRLTPLAFTSVIASYVFLKYGWYSIADVQTVVGLDAWHSTPDKVHSDAAIRQGLIGIYLDDWSLNSPLWTLKIEFWGSLLIFSFCALFFNTERFFLVAGISIAVMIVSFGGNVYYFSLFLLGAMLLKAPQNNKLSWLFIPGIFLGSQPESGVIATAITNFCVQNQINIKTQVSIVLLCIGAILLMVSVLNNDLLKKMLSARPVAWLGRISFAMYVFHHLVIMLVGSFFYLLTRDHLGHIWAALIAVTVTFAVTIIVSMLAYRFIDRPSQKLANKIANWLIRPVKAE